MKLSRQTVKARAKKAITQREQEAIHTCLLLLKVDGHYKASLSHSGPVRLSRL